MARWGRFISTAGPLRIVTAVGGLLVLVGAVRSILITASGVPPLAALAGLVLVGGPGLGLLYGRRWLARSDIHPDAYSRVAGWCLGCIGVILVVLGLVELNPAGSLDRPFFSLFMATGLASVAGFGVGAHEARAITRAREAEEHRDSLRAERDLRERIFETSPIGITVVDTDRSVRMVNERAAAILGLRREELLDLEYDESLFDATDADGEPIGNSVFEQVLSTGDVVYDVERRIPPQDGDRIWLSVSGAPLRDPSGELSGVVFAFEDTTELKEAIENLERSNDRLRQFVYAASHDLQEPLRMVSSYLQLLENRYEDDLDEDAREFIDFAVDGADRMRQMVEDLLEYSRLERRDPNFERIDCDAVVQRVQADLQVQIEEAGAEIVTDPLPTVRGDEQQVEQLFRNLVSNALKYNDGEPPRVEIAAHQRNDHWEFSIADNGIGIEPEHTDQVFEVFNRLHGDTEAYSGTGIGLSLCQEIVERHGGRIWVDSEPGEGSTFYFTLPAIRHPESQVTG
jgi:PAS domain S-box-containing protein